MLTYLNNSETAVVVLHEIYGINQHITGVCERISAQELDVICPNMLVQNQLFNYNQQDLAYSNFINHIGFDQASHQIKNLLYDIRKQYKNVYLIGFSVGATVAWLCSKEQDLCDAVIGFYGSRIRDYLNFTPHCPVLLFFPTREKSFDVLKLTEILHQKAHTQVKILSGTHGFADPFAQNYQEASAQQAYEEMLCLIKRKRSHNLPNPL